MGVFAKLSALSDVMTGSAVFHDEMPIWLGRFGDGVWPFVEPDSPLYVGEASSSIVWRDFIDGKGATFGHPSSITKSKYEHCLTPSIVGDLKVAAVIYANFPSLIRHARRSKGKVDPKTVKGRIDELGRFFSVLIRYARREAGVYISELSQISFALLQQVISLYPGRSDHLKRALKLISDPVVQKNISQPLQWGLVDVEKHSTSWRESNAPGGIATLSDAQFLFILNHCKLAMVRFKEMAGIEILDGECRSLADSERGKVGGGKSRNVLDEFYLTTGFQNGGVEFKEANNIALSEVHEVVSDGHISAMCVILLFTGMRLSDTAYLKRDCLDFRKGYWFLASKEIKRRPKDTPICDDWLAIDIVRDAYEILMAVTRKTDCEYLFSSPFLGYAAVTGYRQSALNIKFNRWLKRIDVNGLFRDWTFSVHQCRETLVSQLAKQRVGMPFISMQLKHFHSQFNSMPNAVTAGYGQYREQLMASVEGRMAEARESALLDLYGEDAKFAGGGGAAHKARIDTFFAGLGLYGEGRVQYIKEMARRGVKLMPTSIGNCGKNFAIPAEDGPPPCYGDYQCDPECHSHVITARAGTALLARKAHALAEAERETDIKYRKVWWGMVETLDGHIAKLGLGGSDD